MKKVTFSFSSQACVCDQKPNKRRNYFKRVILSSIIFLILLLIFRGWIDDVIFGIINSSLALAALVYPK